MDIRLPAVAGVFYPSDAAVLREDITRYLNAVPDLPAERPKAIVSPHAGFMYSGPVAAFAYAAVRPYAPDIRRVVLLAPAHRFPFRGLAVPSVDIFRTPAGDVRIDTALIEKLLENDTVNVLDVAFDNEHAIEVQLPFLQQVMADFSLAPILVGDAQDEDVAGVVDAIWGGEETLVVISSDLSHYLDYESARQRDDRTRMAIEGMAPEQLSSHDACGFLPLRGLLKVARRKGLRMETLDMRNSGDTAGSREQVVGYGSYAAYP